MEIEIVDFYPVEKQERRLLGSLHIYLIDLKLDIRGFRVIFDMDAQKRWRFIFPHISIFFPKEQKSETFPVVQFSDAQMNRDLIKQIRKKASEYIRKNFFNEGMELELKKIEGKMRFSNSPLNRRPMYKSKIPTKPQEKSRSYDGSPWKRPSIPEFKAPSSKKW